MSSFLTLNIYLSDNKDVEKLVLPQLDIILDRPTTSPVRICSTSPVLIHRVSDLAKADLELVYNTTIKTLTICARGPLSALLDMARLPPSFDDDALRQYYIGGTAPLPPLASYIYNAARSFAILKHHNERLGPRDMRSAVALWMSPIVRGSGKPAVLPTEPPEMVAFEDLEELKKSEGRTLTRSVNTEYGYGIMAFNSNLNALHVAVVKISSATLKPEFLLRTEVSAGKHKALFGRDAQGDVRGLLRFANHAGLPFNVDLVRVVFSTERIDSVDELLEDEKAWDALNVKVICREDKKDAKRPQYPADGEEEVDIADALIQRTKNLKL